MRTDQLRASGTLSAGALATEEGLIAKADEREAISRGGSASFALSLAVCALQPVSGAGAQTHDYRLVEGLVETMHCFEAGFPHEM